MTKRQAISLFVALALTLVECVVVFDVMRNQAALLFVVFAAAASVWAGYEFAGNREGALLMRSANALFEAVDALRTTLERHIDEHDVKPYDPDALMSTVTGIVSRLTNIEKALAFVLVRVVPEYKEQILVQLSQRR